MKPSADIRLLLFVVCAAIVPNAAAAQEPGLPTPVTLADVIRVAGERRDEIEAARARTRAGEARPAIVSALDDPMMSPTLDHLPFMMGGADVSVTVEQQIPLSGIRRSRRAVALADIDRLRAEANRTTLDVGIQAANAFLMLQERRRTQTLVTEQIGFARDVVNAANARYSSATAPQSDVLRAEVEVAWLDALARALVSEVRGAEAMLNATLALDPDLPVPPLAPVAFVEPVPTWSAIKTALTSRPELAAGRAEIARAEAGVQVMRDMFRPMATIRTGPSYTMAEGRGWMAMVGLSLPIWRGKLRAGVAEAQAMRAMSEADLRAMTRMIEGDAAASVNRLQAARERQTALTTDVLPRARMAIEPAVAGYSSGQLPLVSVIDAVQVLWRVQSDLIAADTELGLAWARLGRAIGSYEVREFCARNRGSRIAVPADTANQPRALQRIIGNSRAEPLAGAPVASAIRTGALFIRAISAPLVSAAVTAAVIAVALSVQHSRGAWPFEPAAVPVATIQGTVAAGTTGADRNHGRVPVDVTSDTLRALGIRLETVGRQSLTQEVRAVATVVPDESRISHVHTRVSGWVEQLDVNTTGEMVRAGEPLLRIFSQELLSSQTEYLAARRTTSASGITSVVVAGGRTRLGVLGMSPAEIDAIEQSDEPKRLVTVFAPRSGVVVNRGVTVGTSVDPSTTLVTLADLSRVWVLAEVPEASITAVRAGSIARLDFPASGRPPFTARVDFIYPTLSERTRTLRVRLSAANSGGALRPGLYGTADFVTTGQEVITVPRDAVVDTGLQQHVFVATGNRFEPRPVTLGVQLTDRVEIRSGLQDGERIVAAGVFLLDSESRLRATGGTGGHDHGGSTPGDETPPPPAPETNVGRQETAAPTSAPVADPHAGHRE